MVGVMHYGEATTGYSSDPVRCCNRAIIGCIDDRRGASPGDAGRGEGDEARREAT